MKNNFTRSILPLLVLLFVLSARGHSGFMRDVLNAVKGTAQNRANNTATQETNKAIDPIDPANPSKSHSGNSNGSSATPADTAAVHGVLGAFARAAAENPNDTSAAELTMKALGIMTGEKQVSAQDSAKAIKAYMTAGGGSGLHYEYAITMSGKKSTTTDSSELYFTDGGEGRSEMRIPMPGVRMERMISIGHVNQPGYTIMLYPESKTYSLKILDTSYMIKTQESYQVTRIGTETIQGYPCMHSRIVTTSGSGMFQYSSAMDVWASTTVPGYPLYKKMTSLQTVKTGMIRALENAGGGGVFVKIVVTGKEYSMEQLLIKADQKSFPASLFLIPSNYSESENGMVYHMIPPSAR